MHRRSMLIGLGAALSLACARDVKDDAGQRAHGSAPATNAEPRAARMVAAVLDAPDQRSATRATAALLADAGVEVRDDAGVTHPAAAPASPIGLGAVQLFVIAAEARARATRVTLEQAGALLDGFGVPLDELALATFAPADASPAAAGETAPQADAAAATTGAAAAARAEFERHRAEIEAQLARMPEAQRKMARAMIEQQMNAIGNAGRPDARVPARADRPRLDADTRAHIAGRRLVTVLAALVREARADAADPASFDVLALDALAARQGVDLGDATLDPTRLRWGLLELELFGQSFFRGAVRRPSRDAMRPLTMPSIYSFAAYAPQAEDPGCSDVVDALDKLVPGTAWAYEVARDKGIEKLAGLGGHAAETMLKASKFLGVVNALSYFYAGTVDVTKEAPADDPTHKPVSEGGGGQKKKAVFKATAGVADDVWNEYRKAVARDGSANHAVKDCLRTVGLPIPDAADDIGRDASNWRIKWKARISPSDLGAVDLSDDEGMIAPGRRVAGLTRASDHSATARYTVRINAEPTRVHEDRQAKEQTGTIEVSAEVESSSLPKSPLSLLTMSVVDVGVGAARDLITPKSAYMLEVTYHEADGILVQTALKDMGTLHGQKCGGPEGTWRLLLVGEMLGYPIRDAARITVTLGPDLTGVFDGVIHIAGYRDGHVVTGTYLIGGRARFDAAAKQLVLSVDGSAGEVHIDGNSDTPPTPPPAEVVVPVTRGACR